MPKVKYYTPPPNAAKDLIARSMKARKVTSVELGKRLGLKPETVRVKKLRGNWSVTEYKKWCQALNITDPEEVGKAVLGKW